MVAGQAFAGFTHGDAVDLPMDAVAGLIEGQKGGLMQQAFQIQIGTFADQLQFELEGLADGLTATEFEHLLALLRKSQ